MVFFAIKKTTKNSLLSVKYFIVNRGSFLTLFWTLNETHQKLFYCKYGKKICLTCVFTQQGINHKKWKLSHKLRCLLLWKYASNKFEIKKCMKIFMDEIFGCDQIFITFSSMKIWKNLFYAFFELNFISLFYEFFKVSTFIFRNN